MTFDGSQKVIGKGAQAEVLLYHGFAYKVYKESYPAEWIDFEKKQQGRGNLLAPRRRCTAAKSAPCSWRISRAAQATRGSVCSGTT